MRSKSNATSCRSRRATGSSSSAAISCASSRAGRRPARRRASRRRSAQESGRGGQSRDGAARRLGVAAHRREGPRHRLHRQDRDRPEHPHVARAGGRRRAARAADSGHDGDGRHRSDAVRRGHLRIAVDAADGAAAGPRRGQRARDADRSRGRAVAGRSTDADGEGRQRDRRGWTDDRRTAS